MPAALPYVIRSLVACITLTVSNSATNVGRRIPLFRYSTSTDLSHLITKAVKSSFARDSETSIGLTKLGVFSWPIEVTTKNEIERAMRAFFDGFISGVTSKAWHPLPGARVRLRVKGFIHGSISNSRRGSRVSSPDLVALDRTVGPWKSGISRPRNRTGALREWEPKASRI